MDTILWIISLNIINPKKIIIYSRDEFKQFIMENEYKEYKRMLRFFIGDVRDEASLEDGYEGCGLCDSCGGAEAGARVRV